MVVPTLTFALKMTQWQLCDEKTSQLVVIVTFFIEWIVERKKQKRHGFDMTEPGRTLPPGRITHRRSH
jgi:hypothetical protein